jgi:hypothetical protein
VSETAVTTDPMHCAAASDDAATRPCDYCLQPFAPQGRQRKRQRFCSVPCRNEYHAQRIGQGMRGVVSSVRIMRRGSVSVVLRFGLDERERALKLEPGKVVAVEGA